MFVLGKKKRISRKGKKRLTVQSNPIRKSFSPSYIYGGTRVKFPIQNACYKTAADRHQLWHTQPQHQYKIRIAPWRTSRPLNGLDYTFELDGARRIQEMRFPHLWVALKATRPGLHRRQPTLSRLLANTECCKAVIAFFPRIESMVIQYRMLAAVKRLFAKRTINVYLVKHFPTSLRHVILTED